MASKAANNFRVLVATKLVDFANDTFKGFLMQSGFSFNPDSHDLYSDISASELATGGGYTKGTGVTLAGNTVTQNDADDRCDITFNTATITATGADIGPTCGIIICDDTVANDPVVGFIDFGSDYTIADGGTGTLKNIKIRI